MKTYYTPKKKKKKTYLGEAGNEGHWGGSVSVGGGEREGGGRERKKDQARVAGEAGCVQVAGGKQVDDRQAMGQKLFPRGQSLLGRSHWVLVPRPSDSKGRVIYCTGQGTASSSPTIVSPSSVPDLLRICRLLAAAALWLGTWWTDSTLSV